MPVFVWRAAVVVVAVFSAQVLLDDETVVEQVLQPVENAIALLDLPQLLLGVG